MVVNDLSKELGVKNRDVIDFLKSKNFKISSHMQTVSDEMIEMARERFGKSETEEPVEEKKVEKPNVVKKTVPSKNTKRFNPDDLIPCRSLVPWKLLTVGMDRTTKYYWPNFGHVEYVSYKDLSGMRRDSIIKDALIMIEDADLCEQWKNDLGDVYQKYLGVEYPEEFFELTDSEFEAKLKNAPDTFKDVIKFTAMDMIRNENYPSVQKIIVIDNILGTGIKEFL